MSGVALVHPHGAQPPVAASTTFECLEGMVLWVCYVVKAFFQSLCPWACIANDLSNHRAELHQFSRGVNGRAATANAIEMQYGMLREEDRKRFQVLFDRMLSERGREAMPLAAQGIAQVFANADALAVLRLASQRYINQN